MPNSKTEDGSGTAVKVCRSQLLSVTSYSPSPMFPSWEPHTGASAPRSLMDHWTLNPLSQHSSEPVGNTHTVAVPRNHSVVEDGVWELKTQR